MELRCTQCGAVLEAPSDARLLSCSFCSTALVVDGTVTLFHEVMLPTIQTGHAVDHLRRFLAGGDTVAGLDRQASIGEPRLEYFPFWAFTIAGPAGEHSELMPAAPSSWLGLQGAALPPGEARQMDASITGDAPVIEPELPLATARQWLADRHPDVSVKRTVLFHLPVYHLHYSWRGRSFAAGVDAVSGKVYPADFPAKAETPYKLVAALAVLVFGIEGLIVSNLAIKLALYLLSAPPLIAVAWLTSRRV